MQFVQWKISIVLGVQQHWILREMGSTGNIARLPVRFKVKSVLNECCCKYNNLILLGKDSWCPPTRRVDIGF